VNEALDLRIGIRVIFGNMLLFPFSLILRDRLVKLFKLGVLIPTMTIGFGRIVFSIPSASLCLSEGGGVFGVGEETRFG
jgi:hypothetical protein